MDKMAKSTFLSLLILGSSVVGIQALSWSLCGTNLECATLDVPLEYGTNSPSSASANIALIRYNATVDYNQRLGSLLVNPGGPGASGVSFVQAGAGSAISTLSGGFYDVIGWDPRGVGQTSPILECFSSAGAEYNFSSLFPGGPNLWLGMFSNSSYDFRVQTAISNFDTSVAKLAEACISEDSPALYTSSAAYVARDMAAIVDALDGSEAKLNYWGFSYGTIYLTEFIQAFPTRVGRIVADGVVNPKANAMTYKDQLPYDQASVRAALNDFADFCAANSNNCPLAVPPSGVTTSLRERIDNLFENLFLEPIQQDGLSISLDIFNVFLWSFLRVPVTWAKVASIIQGLEVRNATLLVDLLQGQTTSYPADPNAAGVGTLSEYPLTCIDNAPSSSITLEDVIILTGSISVSEDTPLLSAGLTPISFCRNFPDTRPQIINAGVTLMEEVDAKLSASNTTILIVNPNHDPITPLISAMELNRLLPNSSKIAVRGGSGHTSVSVASLSLAQTILDFFTSGIMPANEVYHNIDQEIFPAGSGVDIVSSATFNGTAYTESEMKLLEATYDVLLAFLALA